MALCAAAPLVRSGRRHATLRHEQSPWYCPTTPSPCPPRGSRIRTQLPQLGGAPQNEQNPQTPQTPEVQAGGARSPEQSPEPNPEQSPEANPEQSPEQNLLPQNLLEQTLLQYKLLAQQLGLAPGTPLGLPLGREAHRDREDRVMRAVSLPPRLPRSTWRLLSPFPLDAGLSNNHFVIYFLAIKATPFPTPVP